MQNVKWRLSKVFPRIFFLPHMTSDEYGLFQKLCRNKKVVLEYGSGGSTIYLVKKKKQVFSVESNPDFFTYMNSIKLVKRSVNKTLHFQFIDLGPTNQWGKPLETEHTVNWFKYYTEIWKVIAPLQHPVDVIFIDGRFRICCCLYSILKVIEYNWTDTIFIMHDFWRREKYHVVLEFLQELESSTDLAAFKLKENINTGRVQQMINEYALVTS